MLTDTDIAMMKETFLKERPFNCMGGMGIQLIDEVRRLRKELRDAEVHGIRMAASVASDYDKYSSHPYLVSDCILGKLNVRQGRIRKNKGVKRLYSTHRADLPKGNHQPIEKFLDSLGGSKR